MLNKYFKNIKHLKKMLNTYLKNVNEAVGEMLTEYLKNVDQAFKKC